MKYNKKIIKKNFTLWSRASAILTTSVFVNVKGITDIIIEKENYNQIIVIN